MTNMTLKPAGFYKWHILILSYPNHLRSSSNRSSLTFCLNESIPSSSSTQEIRSESNMKKHLQTKSSLKLLGFYLNTFCKFSFGPKQTFYILNLFSTFRSDRPITALLLRWNPSFQWKPWRDFFWGGTGFFFYPVSPLPFDRCLLQPIRTRAETTCRILLTWTNESASWENLTFYGQRQQSRERE